MKLKYYFLLVILALFTSCSNELGMQDNLNDSKILLSSDEYISIAYDNPGIITSEEAKQLVLDFNPTGLQDVYKRQVYTCCVSSYFRFPPTHNTDTVSYTHLVVSRLNMTFR